MAKKEKKSDKKGKSKKSGKTSKIVLKETEAKPKSPLPRKNSRVPASKPK